MAEAGISARRAPPRKSYVVHVILLAAVGLAGYAGWTWKAQRDARIEAAAARDALHEIDRQWSDAYALASTTSRIALAGPIATLQALARRTEDVHVPPCLVAAKSRMVAGTRGGATAMQMFQAKVPDWDIVRPRTLAEESIKAAREELAAAKCPG